MTISFREAGFPRYTTQIVGSWCKPAWLCDYDLVYGPEGTWWRLEGDQRERAIDDSVRLAMLEQHAAGLDLLTDGEQRRQTFSGHFYAWGGIDQNERGEVTNFANDVTGYLTMKARPASAATTPTGTPIPQPKFTQPRVVGPLTWNGPILANEVAFAKSLVANWKSNRIKVTLIGPCTLALRLVDEHYGSLDALTLALANVVNAEARALASMGVDVIQIDEPEVHFRYSQLEPFAVEAIDLALAGLEVPTIVHMCYGYSKNIAEKRQTPVYDKAVELLGQTAVTAISLEYEQPGYTPDLLAGASGKEFVLGVLNLDTEAPVETVDHIVARAGEAATAIGPDRIHLSSDCGMWFLPRERAIAKVTAMAEAAQQLRSR